MMNSDQDIKLKVRNLSALSESEIATLGQLKISAWQEIKGGSFAESLEAWQEGAKDHVIGFCFLIETHPVGLTLFKRPPLSPSWVSTHSATIHGLKIATPWQRKGLGHQAFRLGVDQLKEEWPTITTLMLGVDADNAAALAVYRAYGMSDSGPIHKGNDGLEHRFKMSL